MLQYLQLMPEDASPFLSENVTQDWKRIFSNIRLLFNQLSHCQPPGCSFQKYLRWVEGCPADCGIIRRVLVGVSMLPPTFRELTEPVREKEGTIICFNLRARTVLSWLFLDDKDIYKKDKNEKHWETECNVGQYFEFNKFKKLMEYVTEKEESEQRLRQLLAEYRQVSCRGSFMNTGFTAWTGSYQSLLLLEKRSQQDNYKYLARQMGALLGLIMLNNREYQFGYWA